MESEQNVCVSDIPLSILYPFQSRCELLSHSVGVLHETCSKELVFLEYTLISNKSL